MAEPFTFIAGADDFFVGLKAAEVWKEFCAQVDDDLNREVVQGTAGNQDEVAAVVGQAIAAIQTLSLFGGRKAVWLKDVTFLADTVTGRAEYTLEQVARLQQVMATINPADVLLLVSASPVDRRRREFKWFVDHGRSVVISQENVVASLLGWLKAEARRLGVEAPEETLEALIQQVDGDPRLASGELAKLATWLGKEGGRLTPEHVRELVPPVAGSDFFEVADAFHRFDTARTLAAVRRHFFAGESARPLLASLQKRNRLLIQLRALHEGGLARLDSRGFSKRDFEAAASRLGGLFGGSTEKDPLNVFSQSPFYLQKLAPAAAELPLKRLVAIQGELVRTFGELLERRDEEAVIRDLVMRCAVA